MGDTNKTRVRKKKEELKNLSAFLEIIGDPDRDMDGIYNILHNRSIRSIEDKLGETVENISASKPSLSDFFCDVDKVISDALESPCLIAAFLKTYLEFDKVPILKLTKKERKQCEQSIGKLLRARGIFPVKRYFTVREKK